MTDTKTKPASKRPRKMARAPKADTGQAAESGTEAGVALEPCEQPDHVAAAAAAPKPPSKASKVLDLLSRPEGATLDQMVTATGWLPHTTRAALTGLKKKGHTIERRKVGDLTTYFRV